MVLVSSNRRKVSEKRDAALCSNSNKKVDGDMLEGKQTLNPKP